MSGSDDNHTSAAIQILEADARYARERASLYRARAWGGKRATSDERLRQLESAAELAAARLRRARKAPGAGKSNS